MAQESGALYDPPMSENPLVAVQELTVGDESSGQRIDNFLLKHLKGVPKSRIYRILRKGEVRVNKGRIKPDYRLQWPEGLSESDPDLSYPKLPVNLNWIQRDLDDMRTAVQKVGSDFAVSSFLWMVKDGMVLDPVRHKYILEQLNSAYYPYRYRDLERLAIFQNRLLVFTQGAYNYITRNRSARLITGETSEPDKTC